MAFKSLKGIKGKLFLSAVVPLVGFFTLGFVAHSSISKISYLLNESYGQLIPNVEALGGVEGSRARIGQYLWGALGNKDDAKHRDTYIEKALVAIGEFRSSVKAYESSPNQPGETEIYAPMKAINEDYMKEVEGFTVALKSVKSQEDYEKIRLEMVNGVYLQHSTLIKKVAGTIIANYSKLAKEKNALQAAETKGAVTLLIAITSACSILVFGILMLLGSRLSKAVSSVVSRLSDSGQQVNQAIGQLSLAGQSLSQSSTESAASLEETVASLEEMSSMVKLNSDNAKQAAALAQTSRQAAEAGEAEIKNLVESMNDISKSSKKIEEIINVIDDIAFQTNLLALNAAVEAARAGEQGKGFAVVADAVRSLAQRSASAAKDITSLIKDSVEKIDHGTEIADRSGGVLSNIVTSIKKVSDLNNEISAASTEQTAGISQINKAMNQLDASSQSNAASSEEIASTAEEISSQSNQMQILVKDLSQIVMGSDAAPVDISAKKSVPSQVGKEKTSAKVITMPKAQVKPRPSVKAPKENGAAQAIPFDEDEPRAKVGTTDGF
jgi:methyl-accepting chemotaxis protein